jgi:microcystin-dependent protein
MANVSLLATVADQTASQIAGGASQLVPSGVVMAFAGATAPTGWLLCGGALISRTTYPDLFAAIGTAHGSGDGSTTFALPNYSGRFLRGRANGSANDPDRASRTAAATGGATGDNVGSVQGNATTRPTNAFTSGAMSANASHSHNFNAAGTLKPVSLISGGGSFGFAAAGGSDQFQYPTSTAGSSIDHTHTVTGGGDNETRPLNAYVNYIIKI